MIKFNRILKQTKITKLNNGKLFIEYNLTDEKEKKELLGDYYNNYQYKSINGEIDINSSPLIKKMFELSTDNIEQNFNVNKSYIYKDTYGLIRISCIIFDQDQNLQGNEINVQVRILYDNERQKSCQIDIFFSFTFIRKYVFDLLAQPYLQNKNKQLFVYLDKTDFRKKSTNDIIIKYILPIYKININDVIDIKYVKGELHIYSNSMEEQVLRNIDIGVPRIMHFKIQFPILIVNPKDYIDTDQLLDVMEIKKLPLSKIKKLLNTIKYKNVLGYNNSVKLQVISCQNNNIKYDVKTNTLDDTIPIRNKRICGVYYIPYRVFADKMKSGTSICGNNIKYGIAKQIVNVSVNDKKGIEITSPNDIKDCNINLSKDITINSSYITNFKITNSENLNIKTVNGVWKMGIHNSKDIKLLIYYGSYRYFEYLDVDNVDNISVQSKYGYGSLKSSVFLNSKNIKIDTNIADVKFSNCELTIMKTYHKIKQSKFENCKIKCRRDYIDILNLNEIINCEIIEIQGE